MVGGGVLADLRKSTSEVRAAYSDIVLRGIFLGKGMPNFSRWLDEDDVKLIRRYVDSRSEGVC